MMKFLAAVALVVFWTVFSFSIAVLEEPPAFLAYGFGAITGAGWVLLVLYALGAARGREGEQRR